MTRDQFDQLQPGNLLLSRYGQYWLVLFRRSHMNVVVQFVGPAPEHALARMGGPSEGYGRIPNGELSRTHLRTIKRVA